MNNYITKRHKLVNTIECDYYKLEYSDICISRILQAQLKLLSGDLSVVRNNVIAKISKEMPKLLQSLPYYNKDKMTDLKAIADNFSKRFQTVVVVGMGGALLNSKCLSDFYGYKSDFNVIFIHKICKVQLAQVKNLINLEKTGFLFISNSGDTIETITLAEYWYEILKALQYKDFHNRFIFVYGLKNTSLLQEIHKKIGGIFIEYDSCMGGRFATFTTPHILLGMLYNLNLNDFFAGANSVLKEFLSGSKQTERAIISGAITTSYGLSSTDFYRNGATILSGSYDTRFDGMIHWYCTALAETLGKNGINITPIHINLPLDQHGLLQAILVNNTHQQLNVFDIAEDINSKIKKIGNMLQKEVYDQFRSYDIPVRKIILKNTEMSSFGGIMMHMILEVITAGVLIGIEPFIQPQIDTVKSNLAVYYRQNIVP